MLSRLAVAPHLPSHTALDAAVTGETTIFWGNHQQALRDEAAHDEAPTVFACGGTVRPLHCGYG
jgi:hypothetical protein